MVGRGSSVKKPLLASAEPAATSPESSSTAATGGETHSVAPEEITTDASDTSRKATDEPLGSRRKKSVKQTAATNDVPAAAAAKSDASFTPQTGQEFLQVTALPRDHASAVASVLRRKGFRAHAVAKPGDPSVYRVIVGPIRNAGELSSTRDSLRKTGFSQVLIQRYQ